MATAIIIGVGRIRASARSSASGSRPRASMSWWPAAPNRRWMPSWPGIVAAGGRATAVVADATNEADIVALFDKAGADLELAIYNAGNNTPGKIIDMDAAYFEQSWRVVCFGGFLFGARRSAAWC